ncbi:hypothetical protein HO133_007702 [Letharia lupina]|uniref:Glycosyltransferase 2-like domain-containing protein n=1 Tax=Letharia lupina TaxID=560253 RepID=A0A8H6FHH3_9LECA|nr:uncharacterized protein HO133_007702 [Letharia lupina]KAF6227974.1 hypothetical protein HO133_007702 [Letharia lupina]
MATIYAPSQEGSTPLSEISICKEEASAEPSIHAVEPTYTIESTYAVEKIGDMDNAGYVATWKLRLNRLLPLSSVCAIAAYWLYFAFRVRYTVAAQELRHTVYPVAWLFISIELGVALPVVLTQLLQCFSIKPRRRPRLRVLGEHVPMVDVLITCAGEETVVVLDTLRAAAAIDWPRDRMRVVVLDDKASEEVRREVELLGLDNPSIHYSARKKTKGVPHHFKAGNLNHGLSYVDGLEGEKAEYVAALDADMIVERAWLRAIIAHLITDPGLALACPPQLFYNIPKNDPLYQNLAFFFGILEGVKDAIGSAWCTGSGYALRRTALDQIGGFPTGSVAEDVFCSNLLLGAGWRTCYVQEPLQYGTVPDSFSGHIKQRARWTIGTVQTSAKLNFFLFGRICRGMSVLHRFTGFVFTLGTLSTVSAMGSLLMFPIVLVSGFRLVAYADNDQLRWLLRLAFFSLAINRVNEWVAFVPAGYRFAWRGNLNTLWMAPYHGVAIVRSFLLPAFLGGKLATFSSSGSIDSVINERDARNRAPLMRRIKAIWWNGGAFIHLSYVFFTVGAAALSTARAFTTTPDTYEDRLFYILTHAGWPPLVWLVASASCMIPIKYAVSPPSMPDREDLLRRDKDTGIAHPTDGAKRSRWGKTNYLHEGFYAVVTIYTTILFFGTWFY